MKNFSKTIEYGLGKETSDYISEKVKWIYFNVDLNIMFRDIRETIIDQMEDNDASRPKTS